MSRGLFLLAALVLAAGCGSSERAATPIAAPPPPPRQPQPEPAIEAAPSPEPSPEVTAAPKRIERARRCAGDEAGLGGDRLSYAAVAERETAAYDRPGGEQIASFEVENENGHAMVFGVRRVLLDAACKIEWYRVRLPMRPNGIEGWVRAGDVRLLRVHTRIHIDLSDRELVLYRGGEPVLRAPVAVGAPGTPTPTGRYYVNQRIIASDPSGPWGPAALGISAFSDVLQAWSQGGPIGIHGTNAPSSIGRAASHGCIRLENDVLQRVFETADAGTPVIIEA
ncbi:MAG TPA: L,D-transpeptidase [Gaiellaceae bacterium]|nr:L,D-transpeptidase [Gaiellaceae bacterium]